MTHVGIWQALFLSIVLGLSFVSCGTRPAPMVAVEGTTIAIAVPNTFDVGYGRSISAAIAGGTLPSLTPAFVSDTTNTSILGPPLDSADLTLEDFQRGELVAVLKQGTTALAFLPVRAITRAAHHAPDPPTTAVTNGTRKEGILVALDIPLEDHAGNDLLSDEEIEDFEIEIHRFRRNQFQEDDTSYERIEQYYEEDWRGWGNGNSFASIPIKIQDQQEDPVSGQESEQFTPYDGYQWLLVDLGYYVLDFLAEFKNSDISGSVPDPRFFLSTVHPAAQPNAWELTLRVPHDRIRIVDILPLDERATVIFDTPGTVQCDPNGPLYEDMHIKFINPFQSGGTGAVRWEGVWVQFKFKNDVVGCISGPLHASQTESGGGILISPNDPVLTYNTNGVELALPASDFGISVRDFMRP